MKHRILRVRELLKRELSVLLERELTFPEGTLVTVNDVDVTPDLRQCHVFIGVIGSDEARQAVLAKLHAERPSLQKALARRVILKYTPVLHFKTDHTAEQGVRILQILEEIDIPEDEPETVESPKPEQPDERQT